MFAHYQSELFTDIFCGGRGPPAVARGVGHGDGRNRPPKPFVRVVCPSHFSSLLPESLIVGRGDGRNRSPAPFAPHFIRVIYPNRLSVPLIRVVLPGLLSSDVSESIVRAVCPSRLSESFVRVVCPSRPLSASATTRARSDDAIVHIIIIIIIIIIFIIIIITIIITIITRLFLKCHNCYYFSVIIVMCVYAHARVHGPSPPPIFRCVCVCVCVCVCDLYGVSFGEPF